MGVMDLKLALLFLAGAISLCGQTPGDRELSRALTNLDGLRSQVEAGVIPRARLEEAEEALADARDAELLGRTLYGRELTEEQAADMEAAALRRFNRRRAAVDKLLPLVKSGVASLKSLDGPTDQMNWARKEYALVVQTAPNWCVSWRSRRGPSSRRSKPARAQNRPSEAP